MILLLARSNVIQDQLFHDKGLRSKSYAVAGFLDRESDRDSPGACLKLTQFVTSTMGLIVLFCSTIDFIYRTWHRLSRQACLIKSQPLIPR